MTEPLGWGLIGTGGIAQSFAADLMYTKSGRAAAVGSRHMDSANRFADRVNIPNRHASYEALVADPDVDVVYVATPHPMHHANALLALRAGKPVLVEKAFTMNATEAEELQRSAVCSPSEPSARSSRSPPTMGSGLRRTLTFDCSLPTSEGARCWTLASIRFRSRRWC
jgi:hypothetical protein